MQKLRSIGLVLGLLVFCASGFAQAPSKIYVTDGTGGRIYSFAPPSTSATLLTTITGYKLEGIVFGPDQKLYVCDPSHGRIWRVDPSTAATVSVFQSIGSGLQNPQCGRFSSTGDFYVIDELAGSGIWKFTAASLAGSLPTTPANVLGSGPLGAFGGDGDLTQANTGDLLAVDSTNGKLFLSPAPGYATASAIISSGLDHATGIARSSTGDIFIAQKGTTNKVVRYSSGGAVIGACGTFTGGNQPFFLKFTADDTLYVTTSKFDADDHIDPYNTGKIWKVNIASCGSAPVQFAGMPTPPGEPHDEPLAAIGIALTPTTTVTKTAAFTTSKVFSFGFTSMQINATGSCSVSVNATQTPLSALNTLLGTIPGTPFPGGVSQIPYLGEAGFGTLFSVTASSLGSCPTPTSALIGAFIDPSAFSNPRLIQCDSGNCVVDTTTGIYPLGGPIPGDGAVGGKVPNFSQFFLVNAGLLTTTVGGNSPATFCGFNFPLNTTQDPTQARLFDDDDLILVSFRLAKVGGNCTWGPFVDNAQVLVSLAEIAPTFVPVTDPNILITANINGAGILHTYFGLIKVHGLPLGTYGLSLVFTTNNSPVVTTLFKVVPPGTPGSF